MLVVELGFKLDKSIIFYHDLLIKKGLKLCSACITHDIYYTNVILDGLTEGQMKNSCIRLRLRDIINGNITNKTQFEEQEKDLVQKGYKKVFDTIKFDFQYSSDLIKNKVQLQEIKDIGLVVYYDNPDYYQLSLDEQRKKLIDELNSYGFDFKYNDLGLDKLRTLYYKKEMFSKNQNG